MGTVLLCNRPGETACGSRRDEQILEHSGIVDAQARRLHRSSFSHVPIEDLKQEGFIGLIEGIDTWDEEHQAKVPLRVWLIFKVRGRIIDKHRRRHYRNDTAERLPETDERCASPEPDHLEQQERAGLIRKTLGLLPERERIALSTYLDGRLLSSAAAELQITEGATCLLRQKAQRHAAELLAIAGLSPQGL